MIYLDLILFGFIFVSTLIILYLRWTKFSEIYHSNHSFFEVFFIAIYPFEEIIFLILYYLEKQLVGLWISAFIVILFITVALDKWLLKKRHQNVEIISKERRKNREKFYLNKLRRFYEYVKKLEGEKKDLLDCINKLEKEKLSLRNRIDKLKKK